MPIAKTSTSLPIRYLKITSVAVLYFGMAKLGQLLTLPAGNITLVWIASGIILATVWLRGHYIWPGILLGGLAQGGAHCALSPSSCHRAAEPTAKPVGRYVTGHRRRIHRVRISAVGRLISQ